MKRMPALIPVLVAICLIFIGILVFAYVEAKKANPQMIQVTRNPGSSSPRRNALA